MSVRVPFLDRRVQPDADAQHSLLPEEPQHAEHQHAEYVTQPNLPSLRALNPQARLGALHGGPVQESPGRENVPDEAAAASAHLDVSMEEVTFLGPAAAAGASMMERETTSTRVKGPMRTVSSAPSVYRQSVDQAIYSRSVSARSYNSQCGEDTMNLLQDLAGARHLRQVQEDEYEEFPGINNELFRVYLKDIEIPEDVIPVQYKDQYDIALLYAEEDYGEAMGLRSFIEKFCVTETGEQPKVCTIDNNPDMMGDNQIKHIEDAMYASTYIFLLITKNFCQSRWAALQKDECLMTSLRDQEKKWCIVPVLTQKRGERDVTKAYNIPFGLQSLKPIDISRITLGESLVDLMRDDPEDGVGVMLTERIVKKRDKFFLSFFSQMLSRKLPIRKEREKQVARMREKFIRDEKRQKARKEAREMAEQHAKEIAWECQKKDQEEQLKQRFENDELFESHTNCSTPHPSGARGLPPSSNHRESVTHVEGGPSYHYHFYNSDGSTNVPAMPAGKQTTVNVHGSRIVQVGDNNTATTGGDDDEDINGLDINPQRNFLSSDFAPEYRDGRGGQSSDSESEDDLYQSSVSGKEASRHQEQHACEPKMEQAKSVDPRFTQVFAAQEEASFGSKHLSNPSLTQSKDLPGRDLSNPTHNHSEEYSVSSTGLKHVKPASLRNPEVSSTKNRREMPIPLPRTRRPAQGSPTEDDNRNILPKLYIGDPPSDSFSGRYYGHTDARTLSIKEEKEGEEKKAAEKGLLVPRVHQSRKSTGSGQGELKEQMSLLEDVVEQEKKAAQLQSRENYVYNSAVMEEQLDPSISSVCKFDDEIEREKQEAQSRYLNQYIEDISAEDGSIAGSSTSAIQSEENLETHVREVSITQSPTSLVKNSEEIVVERTPTTSMVGEANAVDFCESRLRPSPNLSHDLGEQTCVSEDMTSLSMGDINAFIEQENRDMQRTREIQQISLNSCTEMDGFELPSGLWSIAYAYPHHVDSQYALGRPITASLRSEKLVEEEQEDECD